MPSIRNIIIFVAIAAVIIGGYVYYIRKPADTAGLVVNAPGGGTTPLSPTGVIDDNANLAQDFLTLLLNVKSIKLDDSIFTDKAFISLHDSTIILTPDGDQGRPNPFAPVGPGNDNTALNAAANASIPLSPPSDTTTPPDTGSTPPPDSSTPPDTSAGSKIPGPNTSNPPPATNGAKSGTPNTGLPATH